MKIAIMGAGLSGLACAITLERHGVYPTIFEKRREVDDRFINGEVFLDALNPPILDSFKYISEELKIFLQPVGHISKMVFFSENENATINGRIGFNNIRGRHPHSIVKQMENQIRSKINFNSKYTYEDLLNEYTHIVLATGDGAYSSKMKNYKVDFTVSLKGAIVKGDFDRYTACAWANNDYAPKGYSYLIPLSEKEANIVIAYPDFPENNAKDIENLFNKFHLRAQLDLNQKLDIIDGFQIRNYIIGHSLNPRLGNTFFIGNCFGSIMPFMGFGQFAAILTGVYAAYDLLGKGNYEELVKPISNSYENSLELRKFMEKFNNKDYDRLVKSLDTFLGEAILDPDNIDYLRILSKLIKPINFITK